MGPDGLASAGKALLILDCSTSNPTSTISPAAELASNAYRLIDAPLARTPKEAAAGTLTSWRAAMRPSFARARARA